MFMHASREAGAGVPVQDGEYAIALQSRDEMHLREIGFMLEQRGIPHVRIVENDAPYGGQLMAIGCRPCDRKEVRRWLASLPSAKG